MRQHYGHGFVVPLVRNQKFRQFTCNFVILSTTLIVNHNNPKCYYCIYKSKVKIDNGVSIMLVKAYRVSSIASELIIAIRKVRSTSPDHSESAGMSASMRALSCLALLSSFPSVSSHASTSESESTYHGAFDARAPFYISSCLRF